MTQIAVQMYTLRDLLKTDFLGTFDKVAAIGYRAVELAGTGSTAPAELKKHLDNLGITVCAAHVGIADLEGDLDKVIVTYGTLGCKTLVCPWMAPERRGDQWPATARALAPIADRLNAKGFALGYHNHDFEFETVNGKPALEVIFETAPALKVELDCYWVVRAGQDPVAYINKYANRIPLLHIKDMAAGPDKRFAPVGTGIIDFKPIIAAGKAAGTQWFIVEQDNCYDTPPLDAIRTSFANIKSLGLA